MKPAPYGPFPFSTIKRRPKYSLPGGARVALWVVTNIEFFALDKPMPGESNERPKGSDPTPMVRHWAQRDYGNRVGVYRLMDTLTKHGIRSTVALNSVMCDQHPEVVDDCVKLGWVGGALLALALLFGLIGAEGKPHPRIRKLFRR